jgi:hypothetical protein
MLLRVYVDGQRGPIIGSGNPMDTLIDAFTLVERHDLYVADIVLNPKSVPPPSSTFNPADGYIWGASLRQDPTLPRHHVKVTSARLRLHRHMHHFLGRLLGDNLNQAYSRVYQRTGQAVFEDARNVSRPVTGLIVAALTEAFWQTSN